MAPSLSCLGREMTTSILSSCVCAVGPLTSLDPPHWPPVVVYGRKGDVMENEEFETVEQTPETLQDTPEKSDEKDDATEVFQFDDWALI